MITLPLLILTAAVSTASSNITALNYTINGTDGNRIGNVTLKEGPQGVLMEIGVEGLSPGWHGVHFHMTATCEDNKEGFKKAGSHIMHEDEPHGYLNSTGPHAGDLPSLFVQDDGRGAAEFYTTLVSLNGEKDRPALLDKDGSAIIIHSARDDQETQPTGNSGDRVACGELRK